MIATKSTIKKYVYIVCIIFSLNCTTIRAGWMQIIPSWGAVAAFLPFAYKYSGFLCKAWPVVKWYAPLYATHVVLGGYIVKTALSKWFNLRKEVVAMRGEMKDEFQANRERVEKVIDGQAVLAQSVQRVGLSTEELRKLAIDTKALIDQHGPQLQKIQDKVENILLIVGNGFEGTMQEFAVLEEEQRRALEVGLTQLRDDIFNQLGKIERRQRGTEEKLEDISGQLSYLGERSDINNQYIIRFLRRMNRTLLDLAHDRRPRSKKGIKMRRLLMKTLPQNNILLSPTSTSPDSPRSVSSDSDLTTQLLPHSTNDLEQVLKESAFSSSIRGVPPIMLQDTSTLALLEHSGRAALNNG